MRAAKLKSLPLVVTFLLVACAGGRSRMDSTSGEIHPDVMGPVLEEPKVDSQPVQTNPEPSPVPSTEVYGPSAPTGIATQTTTATEVAAGGATDTATSTATTPTSASASVTDSSSATATATAAANALTPTGSASATATAIAAAARTGEAKLCLVLGPGMAKAMAEASVLEAIHKAKLPVHCVVGTEMGAVVGALFAFSNGSTNNLQWQLFKLNKENFFNFPMISLREPRSSGRKLNEFLRGIFRNKRIEELPIPFATAVLDEERDSVVELQRGDLADSLSASLAVPGIFDPWRVGQDVFRSAVNADPAPVELARKLGGNFIVVVDVLSDGASAASKSRFHKAFTATRSLLRMQKREASFVIQVNTDSIPFDDFGRRGEVLSAGAAAAEKAMPELQAAWEKWSAGSH